MRNDRIALAAVFLFFVAAGPVAASESPWYFRLDAGIASPSNSRVSNAPALYNVNPATGANIPDELEFDSIGPLIGVGVGRRFAGDYRFETALTYRSGFKMSEVTFGGFNANPEYVTGKVKSLSLMFNAYRDFDVRGWSMKPYLGAGIGVARNDSDDYVGLRTTAGVLSTRISTATSKTRPAWSLGGGASLNAAGLVWDFGYRYVDLGKTGSGAVYAIGSAVPPQARFALAGHFRVHELTLGIRF